MKVVDKRQAEDSRVPIEEVPFGALVSCPGYVDGKHYFYIKVDQGNTLTGKTVLDPARTVLFLEDSQVYQLSMGQKVLVYGADIQVHGLKSKESGK